MKHQTTEDRGTARVSLEWRDLEYDIAYMWTRDDGSNRFDLMSHLDLRRATRKTNLFGTGRRPRS